MKTCPKCGELNGDDRTDCFKCRTALPMQQVTRKVCPKCGAIYSPKNETCEACGTRLAVYTPEKRAESGSYAEWWHYLVAILFPLIGLIMGCVYISRGDDELGKTVIITVLVGVGIQVVLGILLVACNAML